MYSKKLRLHFTNKETTMSTKKHKLTNEQENCQQEIPSRQFSLSEKIKVKFLN